MRVERIKLIQQLKARVTALVEASDARLAADQAAEDARREEYWDKTCKAWEELRQYIADCIERDTPPLAVDFPAALARDLGYRRQVVKRVHPQVGELNRLVALLEASPDETVSVPSLERAGFTLGKVLK